MRDGPVGGLSTGIHMSQNASQLVVFVEFGAHPQYGPRFPFCFDPPGWAGLKALVALDLADFPVWLFFESEPNRRTEAWGPGPTQKQPDETPVSGLLQPIGA